MLPPEIRDQIFDHLTNYFGSSGYIRDHRQGEKGPTAEQKQARYTYRSLMITSRRIHDEFERRFIAGNAWKENAFNALTRPPRKLGKSTRMTELLARSARDWGSWMFLGSKSDNSRFRAEPDYGVTIIWLNAKPYYRLEWHELSSEMLKALPVDAQRTYGEMEAQVEWIVMGMVAERRERDGVVGFTHDGMTEVVNALRLSRED